jgi:hypothetical protein
MSIPMLEQTELSEATAPRWSGPGGCGCGGIAHALPRKRPKLRRVESSISTSCTGREEKKKTKGKNEEEERKGQDLVDPVEA